MTVEEINNMTNEQYDAAIRQERIQFLQRVPRTELRAFEVSNVGVSDGDIYREFADSVQDVAVDLMAQTGKSVNVRSIEQFHVKVGSAGGVTICALVLYEVTDTPIENTVPKPSKLLKPQIPTNSLS